MIKVIQHVDVNDKGDIKVRERKINLGPTLLQLNGAGTKATLLHNINHYGVSRSKEIYSKGHSSYNIQTENKFTETESNCINLNRSNIIGGVPFQGNLSITDSETASAVVVAVMPAAIDFAFEELHLNDTNYIPTCIYSNQHKFKNNGFHTFTSADERILDGHLEIMYKCMLVQAYNYHEVWLSLDKDCNDMIVTPEDIERSLTFWSARLGYPKEETERAVKKFMKNITQDKIDEDYIIAKSSSWKLRKWFDGDNYPERFRINPDVKLLPIYEYGNKDTSFNNIVTYDGDMCLKMPGALRAELQAWYESNPRKFRKEFTEMLKDKFVDGIDANGIRRNFNSLFRSLKNRTVKPAASFDVQHFRNLIDIYPNQDAAVEYISTSMETRNSSLELLSA